MNEENMTPELTLTPDLTAEVAQVAAQAQAAVEAPKAPDITLTTDPTAAQSAQAAQAQRDANAVALDESQLTEAERKIVDDFSQKIDIRDSSVVLQYGAAAQKNIAAFSENTLNSVRTKDLG